MPLAAKSQYVDNSLIYHFHHFVLLYFQFFWGTKIHKLNLSFLKLRHVFMMHQPIIKQLFAPFLFGIITIHILFYGSDDCFFLVS